MTLIISDANIFIDLDCADITALMFQLEIDFAVPDILYATELSERHGELPGLGLQVKELAPAVIDTTTTLRNTYRRPSLNDLMALALAQHEECPLLTGDRLLREAAQAEQVEVFGLLWLMEQMYRSELLNVDQLEASYYRMLQARRRLPEVEINQQIERLKGLYGN